MEALEGVVVGELKDLSQQIVKGKRTKRLRISSPTPFAIATGHVSSYEGVGCSNIEENNDDENNNSNLNSTNLRLSPAFSSGDDNNSITIEDEEIARLLILLSQGNPRESSTQNNYLDQNYSLPSTKFTSKKYIETSSNGNEKSGMYVYECKTCNRTFSSFQALGGHRASHKKPRNVTIEEVKKRPFSSVFIDDYDYDFDPSQLSLSRKTSHSNLTSPISYHSMMNKSLTSKIHECSYCGAEFTSGQALGGHMRRHRGSNGNNNNNKNKYNYYNNHNNNISNIQPLLALSPSFSSLHSINPDFVGVKKQKINNDDKDALSLSLSLDLNLPAPSPAENTQKNQESNEFEFAKEEISSPSPQKQNEKQPENDPSLLLSTSQALVVCPN